MLEPKRVGRGSVLVGDEEVYRGLVAVIPSLKGCYREDFSRTFSFNKLCEMLKAAYLWQDGAQCALMSLLRIGVNLCILDCEWATFVPYPIWLAATSSGIRAARIGPQCCSLHQWSWSRDLPFFILCRWLFYFICPQMINKLRQNLESANTWACTYSKSLGCPEEYPAW